MTDDAFPALWRSSDAASIACQKRYLLLVKAHLVLLGLIGVIASWNPVQNPVGNSTTEKVVSWSIAVLMLIALAVSLAIRILKVDDTWFRTRAFAENAKEAAWRFMMRPGTGGPGGSGGADEKDTASAEFLDELDQVRKRFSSVAKELAKYAVNGPEITAQMRAVRQGTLAERLATYKKARLQDQIDWYTRKAKFNASAEGRWFAFILSIEVAAVLFAFLRAALSYEFNPTGAVVGIAACCVAWSQTKRFSDLANTYSVASGDLKMIEERMGNVITEEGLANLVDEAEKAISREHRLWIGRRGP